jgi:hypothetical protein
MHKIRYASTLFVSIACASLALGTAASANAMGRSRIETLENQHSHLCLSAARILPGPMLETRRCDGSKYQKWVVTVFPDNTRMIANFPNECLFVTFEQLTQPK